MLFQHHKGDLIMSVRIIVDSTADLTPEIQKQVTVVPLTIHFGDEEYYDGVTINQKQFYEKLIESDVLPKTSQPTPASFEEVFQNTVDAGDTAVVLTIASKLSGTFQSASIAASEFPGKIHVVDTNTVAIGSGILTELALQLAAEGMEAEAIAARITAERDNVCLVALLDTLEYLKRGGRISKTVAFAGGLLSIKPVIHVKDGEIGMLGKARGSRQGNNLLVKEIEAAGGVDFRKPLLLGYTGLSNHLLEKYMQDSAALWEGNVDELRYTCIGSTVGTHAGPGAVAVAFFKKN